MFLEREGAQGRPALTTQARSAKVVAMEFQPKFDAQID
jgi:hypothetical protein